MIDKEIIQANHYKPAVKVVLLGNSGAGKTSLAQRFVYNKFNHYSESTIGASFFTKYMILDNDDDSIGEGATSSAELQQRQEVKSVKFHGRLLVTLVGILFL
jgi:GTPase SAR1 and related small G proteins